MRELSSKKLRPILLLNKKLPLSPPLLIHYQVKDHLVMVNYNAQVKMNAVETVYSKDFQPVPLQVMNK